MFLGNKKEVNTQEWSAMAGQNFQPIDRYVYNIYIHTPTPPIRNVHTLDHYLINLVIENVQITPYFILEFIFSWFKLIFVVLKMTEVSALLVS